MTKARLLWKDYFPQDSDTDEQVSETIDRHAQLARILQFRGMELLDEADDQQRIEEAMAYRQTAIEMVATGINLEQSALQIAMTGVLDGTFNLNSERDDGTP